MHVTLHLPVAHRPRRLNRRSSCVCVLSSVRFSCYHVFFTLRVLLDFSMVSAVGFHAHVFHLTLFYLFYVQLLSHGFHDDVGVFGYFGRWPSAF